MKDFDRAFEQAVRSLLAERKPTPRASWDVKRIFDTTGAVGSGGRFKAGVETVGPRSRAMTEPRELMRDLGVSDGSGNSDIERCYRVLSQAVSKNEVMGAAYGKPKVLRFDWGIGEKECLKVPIESNELDYRNSVSFIQATLVAAYRAGILKIDGKIQFIYAASLGGPTFYSVEITDDKKSANVEPQAPEATGKPDAGKK